MAGLRFRYQAATGQFDRSAQRIGQQIATAATFAIHDAGEEIKVKARANIAGAGFSVKWQNAMRVNYYPDRGSVSLHPVAIAFHKIPYAGVFEMGATIAGSPLLWLPLPNVPSSINGRAHMTPANYIRMIGPLHTITRPGKGPLLAGYMVGGRGKITISKLKAGATAARHRAGAPAAQVVSIPLFFGISRVVLGKRFDLQPIFDRAAAGLGAGYLRNLKVA